MNYFNPNDPYGLQAAMPGRGLGQLPGMQVPPMQPGMPAPQGAMPGAGMAQPQAMQQPSQQPAWAQPPAAPAAPGGAPTGGQKMDAASIEAFMKMGALKPEQEAIARQRKLADVLREQGMAQMKGTQAGRIYRAPGLANLAASVYSSYKGAEMDKDSDARSTKVADKETQTRQQYLERLFGIKPEKSVVEL